jgi:hypothetical protein
MNVSCKDLDRILQRQNAVELAALATHATGCDACREQLAVEREISAAARAMQRSWESPELWPRIRQRLAVEPRPSAARWRSWLSFEGWSFNWQVATATAALALMAVVSTWLVLGYQSPGPGPEVGGPAVPPEVHQQRLLTEDALGEVQRAEAAYIASIERLSKLAAPKLQSADSPLLANYREKLLVLDSAIAECRAQLEQNRFNAHLRRELLSIYQMKQSTLAEVLQEEVR